MSERIAISKDDEIIEKASAIILIRVDPTHTSSFRVYRGLVVDSDSEIESESDGDLKEKVARYVLSKTSINDANNVVLIRSQGEVRT